MSITTRPRPKVNGAPVGHTDDHAATLAEPLPRPPAPRPTPGRRNPRWIALGVVAVCLGGLLSYFLYATVAAEQSVVAMLTTVHRGQTVQTSDLTTVTISGTAKVNTVAADQLDTLVGQQAIYDLVAGSLVPAGATAATSVPAPGRAAVGLKLAQGRAPLGLLPPGSPVRLIAVPPEGQQVADGEAREFFGAVINQSDSADGTAVLLNVDVRADDAAAVTLLAAQDRIAVLRDAEG